MRNAALAAKEGEGTCYVLMNSQEYGTEVWPCASLDEAMKPSPVWHGRRNSIGARTIFSATSASWANRPKRAGSACDPTSPDAPDTDALTLTLHFREIRRRQEPEEVPCLRRFVREAEEVGA